MHFQQQQPQHRDYSIINHLKNKKSLACNVIGFKDYRIVNNFGEC